MSALAAAAAALACSPTLRRRRAAVRARRQLPRDRGRRPPAPVPRLRPAHAPGTGARAGRAHVPRQLGQRRAVPAHLGLARAGRRHRAGRRVPDRAALPRARQRPPDVTKWNDFGLAGKVDLNDKPPGYPPARRGPPTTSASPTRSWPTSRRSCRSTSAAIYASGLLQRRRVHGPARGRALDRVRRRRASRRAACTRRRRRRGRSRCT